MYEDVVDARTAGDKLSGYNFKGRYLVAFPYQPTDRQTTEARVRALEQTKRQYGLE